MATDTDNKPPRQLWRCPVSNQTPVEEWWNSFTHGLGLVVSLMAFAVIVFIGANYGHLALAIGCTVYGVGLVSVYGTSTLYHAWPSGEGKRQLKIADHVSIFLLIGGTYTPFALGPLRGPLGWTVLGVIWGLVALGVAAQTLPFARNKWFATLTYLAMGWLAVGILSPLSQALTPLAFGALVAGGLTYTIGTGFLVWDNLPYNHALWHLFVIAGSACHYYSVTSVIIAG